MRLWTPRFLSSSGTINTSRPRRACLVVRQLEDRTVPTVVPGPWLPQYVWPESPAIVPSPSDIRPEPNAAQPVGAGNSEINRATQNGRLLVDAGDGVVPSPTVKIAGVSLTKFNPVTKKVVFKLVGDKFDTLFGPVTVTRNGISLSSDALKITPSAIVASNSLVSGKNLFVVSGYSRSGLPVSAQFIVWAGNLKVVVETRDETGQLVKTGMKVKMSIGDDQSVFAMHGTVGGKATFTNVPNWTVLTQATGGKWYGDGGDVAAFGTIVVTVSKIPDPAAVENLDFTQGLVGWTVGPGANATIVDGADDGAKITNPNFQLSTSGEGPRTASTTFDVPAGQSSVRIRYRFITSEVPGGYFGSQYNDWYSVSLRSSQSGNQGDTNTMNGLGLAAFDASGATQWRELTLPVNKKGDKVEATITVANVADGLYDSNVQVDFIKKEKSDVKFKSLQWDSSKGGLKLKYTTTADIEEDTQVDVYFASGSSVNNELGSAVYTFTVPAGTKKGASKTEQIPGANLQSPPDDIASQITHVIAVCDETNSISVKDVSIYPAGQTADFSVLKQKTINVVKGLLRYAGTASAGVSSTIRTAEDQARIMLEYLLKGATTMAQIQANIDEQHNLYKPTGDKVIDVYEEQIADYTTVDEIKANAIAIHQAMVDKIKELYNNDPPELVSNHCVAPEKYALKNVLDIPIAYLTAKARDLFRQAASATLGSGFIDESNKKNKAFHLEVTQ